MPSRAGPRASPSPLCGRAAQPPGGITAGARPAPRHPARGPWSGPILPRFDPASCGVRVARLGPLRRPPTAGRDLYRGRGEGDGTGDVISSSCSASRAVCPGWSLQTSSCPPRREASAWPGWARCDAADGWRDLLWGGQAGDVLWRSRIPFLVGPVPWGTEGGRVPPSRSPLVCSWCNTPGP
jgi:hypothetical protein